MKLKNKTAQEEMIGFALIIIIVAVILLVFLGFFLKNSQKEDIESYEVDSFIQAFLQYTTDCRDYNELEYLSIQKLIFDCANEKKCLDDRRACEVLNSTLTEIVEESWKVGEDRPIQGYELKIASNEEEILLLKKGNITKNYKGSAQYLPKEVDIYFIAYG